MWRYPSAAMGGAPGGNRSSSVVSVSATRTSALVTRSVSLGRTQFLLSTAAGPFARTASKLLEAFAAGLIDNYESGYYGYGDMRLGVARFENGEIFDDGTVSDALLVQP